MIRCLMAAGVIAALGGVALAEDMPHQLAPELVQTEHETCQTSTGYGQRFVIQADIDGDGRRDVVLDYADVLCGGVHEPYCDADGCLFKVWLGSGGGYRKVFEGRVRTWRVETIAGKPVLLIDGHRLGG